MATVTGYFPPPRPGVIRAPVSLSINNDGYIYNGMPRLFAPHTVAQGVIGSRITPESTQHRRGYISFNLIDRLYNRIIVTPLAVNLGNIASDINIDLSVFNAFFTSQTLTSMKINNDNGLTITGPTLPLVFNRLTIKNWRLAISASGDPQINYIITLQFLGLPAIRVTITGRRAVPWLYAPAWSEKFTESLSWLTDVMVSQTGAEQRRARRLSPRRTFEFSLLLTHAERQRFEHNLYRFGSRVWALPVFCDRQELAAETPAGAISLTMLTVGYDIHPNNLMMLQNSVANELIKVEQVYDDRITISKPTLKNWPAGTHIYPVRSAQIAETPKISRLSDDAVKVSVKLIVNEHNDYRADYGFTLYRDKPVLEINSSWHHDLTTEYTRLTEKLDNQTGLINIRDFAARAFTVQQHHFVIYQRAEHDALRRLFYHLRGRLKPIWLPSQVSDFHAVKDINGTTIDVVNGAYTIESGRQDICIEIAGGPRIYRRIKTVTELIDGNQRLGLDGQAFNASLNSILKISLMTLARLNDDDIELEHITDADGLATITTNFRSVRDELERD